MSWKGVLGFRVLSNLGQSINNTTDESNKNRRYASKGNGCIEENQAAECDGELVQGADHGISSGRSYTHTPCGCIGDEDGGHSGDDHSDDDLVSLFQGEVLLNIGGRPVFEEKGGDQ